MTWWRAPWPRTDFLSRLWTLYFLICETGIRCPAYTSWLPRQSKELLMIRSLPATCHYRSDVIPGFVLWCHWNLFKPPHNFEVVIPIIQVKKQRLREKKKKVTQDHTLVTGLGWDCRCDPHAFWNSWTCDFPLFPKTATCFFLWLSFSCQLQLLFESLWLSS